MQTPSSQQPLPNELEVTLLGKGCGESCVVHLGDGRWMIVDSFNEPRKTTRVWNGKERTITLTRPAAQWYLDDLGVSRDAVTDIFITHFHEDHYVGVEALYAHYRKARLHITGAARYEKYRAVFTKYAPPSMREVGAAVQSAEKRKRVPGGTLHSACLTHAGKVVIDVPGIHVRALSPSDDAAKIAAKEMTDLIATGGNAVDIGSSLRDDNRTSISLHVQACDQTVLLCGDVINTPKEFGWAAIVEEENFKQLPKAELVKVAHHGSEKADYLPMWNSMVEGQAPMLVAPFWSSFIPKQDDQARLVTRGALWQAATSTSRHTSEWVVIPKQESRTGVVQARRQPGEQWQIASRFPAHEVTTPPAPTNGT